MSHTPTLLRLRKAIIPLHIVSKILCIGPFSLEKLQSSLFGSAITICQAIGYAIFHLWMTSRDMSTKEAKNMVRQLIDTYNRFSGFCALWFLVLATIFVQRRIVYIIETIELIDQKFQQKLNVTVDNEKWRRYDYNFYSFPFSNFI